MGKHSGANSDSKKPTTTPKHAKPKGNALPKAS